jgi:flagellar M-ring protein FliF
MEGWAMEFLKAQITRIQEQLAGLSATQKMLVASLLAIMVMTLLWWTHWAAVPEMSPLLDQPMSQDEIGQITAGLAGQQVAYKLVGDRVYVPADRKLEILATLGYSQALPRNFDAGFDEIIKQMSWLDPPDKTDKMFLDAKERTLASVIRRFPGVRDAAVVIDPTTDRRLDGTDIEPVATVMLTTTRNGDASHRQLAESAADVVSGAQAGLARSRINVVVDGISFQIKDHSDDSLGNDDDGVQLQQQWEDHYRKEILQGLQDIRGAIVSVSVKVNTAQTMTTKHTVDPKQTVSIPTRTEETDDEQTAEPAAQQEEAGAVPNTGMSLAGGGGGGGGGSTSTSDKSEFETDHTRQDEVIKQGPGDATLVSASVRIPRSYFVAAYKNENGGKDPDDPNAMSAYITAQLAQIRSAIKGCAPVPGDDALYVGSYSDELPPEAPVEQQAAAATPLATSLNRHGKEIGVGILAALSLFMVSMMVRKGAPAAAPPAGGPAEAVDGGSERTLNGNESIVGKAAEKSTSLDGMELDEETVKAQQMLEQVQEMVTSNPDGAANLVKRWLNQ